MLEIIMPKGIFRHPENRESIQDALDEYFSTDVICEDRKSEMLELLKDEPEVLKMVRAEL